MDSPWKIHRSYGAELLSTPNTGRDIPFWKLWPCVKKKHTFTVWKDRWKKNETIFKTREMRTHLRRNVAQKSGPTPNREQLRVFYNADEKTDYIFVLFFNYYRKVHSTAILTSRGTTFLEPSPKVKCSCVNAFYFFDVWFSPTASLIQKYSESVLLLAWKLKVTLQKPALDD